MSTYYERNRERALALAKLYRDTHVEKVREDQRQYYLNVTKPKKEKARRLHTIEFPKPPKPPKPEPRIKTTKRFLAPAPVPKIPKVKKVYPDLSTIKDLIPKFRVTSGLVEAKPGMFLDWDNL
jgi:hypothetical protein